MKKTYKILAGLLALSSVVSLDVSAQLSGNYTINSALATGGTNFQSFSALAAVINTAGISAPVTIDVVAGGTMYVEQVEFTAIAGTSASNTITINGNGNTLSYASANTNLPHTLVLSGTDYMTINTLTVTGTGSSFAMALHLWNNSDNNRFNNCLFEVPLNGTANKQRPVSLSGNLISPTSSAGNGGNNNIWTGCTVTGGYAGFTLYGNSSSPYTVNNQVINCNVRDWYLYGIMNVYSANVTFRGNIVERVNKTSVTTAYCIYMDYQPQQGGNIIEKNKIRRIFGGAPTTGNTMYGVMMYTGGTNAAPNLITNNLISDIASNGDIIGFYDGGYQYNRYINNSVVLDNSASTYGYCYGFQNYSDNTCIIRNNLVSVNRTGSGDKFCMYVSGSAVINNNILYNGQNSNNNYIGYNAGSYCSTFAAWQGTGVDLNGASGVPTFANPATFDYTPTNPAINNVGAPNLGVNTDINNLARNLPAPDAGAFEFFNQTCTSVTGTNAVVTPTNVVCSTDFTPLMLANGYTVNGLSFQWQSANNAIGPFTAISGATLASYVTPQLPLDMYYNVLVTCSMGGSQYTTSVGQVSIAPIVTNTPYYFEGFENISVDEQLPNCSWYRSNAQQCGTKISSQNVWRTARTGNKFAEFDGPSNGGSATQYFWSNGLYLNTGVTYSASLWYATPGWVAWSNLTLMYGNTQTASGLVSIANVSSPSNSSYKSLSNTFTVPTSGYYYMAIKATDNWSGSQLVWDDLEVMIPCNLPSNGAPVVISGQSSVCAGQSVIMTASGAGTYTWSNGPNTSAISPTPMFNTTYSVTGTNILSGCSTTVAKNIIVQQLPPVSIVPTKQSVCDGESVMMQAFGGITYTWSEGPTYSPMINVTPTSGNNTYSVSTSNAFGCSATSVIQITINPAPVITVSGGNNVTICYGASANLSASGAGNGATYEWKSSSLYLLGNSVNVMPNVTTTYSVIGTSAGNCEGTSLVTVAVAECVGINSINGSSAKVAVYPNPNNGAFIVSLDNSAIKTIEVVDITGRLVLTSKSDKDITEVNISSLANGVYYVKVKSENISEVIKVVKQ